MENKRYILFTAGRGPVECGLAVQGVQMRFKKYLDSQNIKYDIVNSQLGEVRQSISTILFCIHVNQNTNIEQWIGTIQWICKSPIRKYSKRKNWFIKCCEINMPDTQKINLHDITVQAYKSSGPGGQHRNKVETAIRIIHHPTKTIVTASDSKSKLQNKKSAMAKLKAAILLKNQEAQQNFEADEWTNKLEIESGNPTKGFYGLKFTEV